MSYSASWTPGSTPRTSKTDSSDSHETAQPVSLSGQRAPMHVTIADWTVVIISIAVTFLPALFFFRRASKSTTEFFASGRPAPWWLVRVSMVATTFSTDTPNLVTNMVRQSGVAENWLWWSFLLTGMLTVFFYARLWRRSNVLTDLEFYELRYSGKAASFVRGFRAVYLGLFFNCVIMAAVNLAAAKIANIVLGWPLEKTLLLMGVVTVFFASVSGLWGVLVTDSIQFGITMTATFALAYFALSQPQVGGLSGLIAQIDPKRLRLIPDFGDWGLTLSVLIIPLTIQWWSVWYPGAGPGGGSYIPQRMLASRTEKDAVVGTLLFNAMHYAMRPWPSILVALSSPLTYPHVSDISRASRRSDSRSPPGQATRCRGTSRSSLRSPSRPSCGWRSPTSRHRRIERRCSPSTSWCVRPDLVGSRSARRPVCPPRRTACPIPCSAGCSAVRSSMPRCSAPAARCTGGRHRRSCGRRSSWLVASACCAWCRGCGGSRRLVEAEDVIVPRCNGGLAGLAPR